MCVDCWGAYEWGMTIGMGVLLVIVLAMAWQVAVRRRDEEPAGETEDEGSSGEE